MLSTVTIVHNEMRDWQLVRITSCDKSPDTVGSFTRLPLPSLAQTYRKRDQRVPFTSFFCFYNLKSLILLTFKSSLSPDSLLLLENCKFCRAVLPPHSFFHRWKYRHPPSRKESSRCQMLQNMWTLRSTE